MWISELPSTYQPHTPRKDFALVAPKADDFAPASHGDDVVVPRCCAATSDARVKRGGTR